MAETSGSRGSGGGCPVKETAGSSLAGGLSGAFASLFGIPRTLDQVKQQQQQGGGCPVDHGKGWGAETAQASLNPLNNERLYSQAPLPRQRVKLGTERQVSSIPKSDFTPKHQPQGSEKWVYPSEQQYYNAMKSKGFNPEERDMSIILAIHNAVNEQGWTQVLDWERRYGGCTAEQPPRLKRFMGRPKDMSPKARLLWLMGYNAPFDRHDWVVERPDGTEVRYVLDFYSGQIDPKDPKPVSMHLDVRPALDSVEALQHRVSRQLDEWKEGLGLLSSSSASAPSAAAGASKPSAAGSK